MAMPCDSNDAGARLKRQRGRIGHTLSPAAWMTDENVEGFGIFGDFCEGDIWRGICALEEFYTC